MSAALPTAPGRATRPGELRAHTAQRRAASVARRRFARGLTLAGLLFWTAWTLLVLGAPLVVARWGGELDGLTYDAAGSPARWVVFGTGVATTAGLLRIHVAAGGSRAAFVRGAAGAALPVGAVFGVLTVALVLLERATYARAGLPWQGAAAALDPATWTGAAVVVVTEAIGAVAYVLVGVAVTAVYRRFGALRGTLLALPLLVPCVVVDLTTRSGVFGLPVRGAYADTALGAPLAVAGALLAAAAAAVLAHRLLRTVPLRP
jgi:hypothetical protein